MMVVEQSVLPDWCVQYGRTDGSTRMSAVEPKVLPEWWRQNGWFYSNGGGRGRGSTQPERTSRADGSTRTVAVERSVLHEC